MEKQICSDLETAAWLAKEWAGKNYYIDFTKFQAVLYACYAALLAIYEIRLCSRPLTGTNGPIFPVIRNFMLTRTEPIQDLLKIKDRINSLLKPKELGLLEETVRFFSQYRTGVLKRWTMKSDGPWYQTALTSSPL